MATLGSGTSYARIYNSRVPPKAMTWPHVAVYIDSEASDAITFNPAYMLERTARLITEGRLQISIQNSETMEDRMDTLAAEIETKLTTALLTAQFANLKSLVLTDTEFSLVQNEETGELAYAAITLAWRVTFNTVEGVPETPV